MPEISGLTIVYLTGARGVNVERAGLTPAGLENDRGYVLYEVDDDDGLHGNRVSQKELPVLAQVNAFLTPDSLQIRHDQAGKWEVERVTEEAEGFRTTPKQVTVNEFGDEVPAYDAGNSTAEYFSDLFGRRVRLAQKSAAWMRGEILAPGLRHNAPIHLISDSAVRALEAVLGSDEDLSSRFRANIRISGIPLRNEVDPETGEQRTIDQLNHWAGRLIVCGAGLMQIQRVTPRCPVPSRDQLSGENRKDVAQVYRDLPSVKMVKGSKPGFGVYGWPVSHVEARLPGLAIGNMIGPRV